MWETFRATVYHNRRDSVMLVLLVIAGIVIFQPMMLRWQTMGDYPVHNDLVLELLENPSDFFKNTPHFLYHLAAGILYLVTPINDVNVAAAWLMTLCQLTLMIIIYYLLRAKINHAPSLISSLALAVLSACLVIIMPINFFTPENLYFGYFAPIVYHNPTVIIMKPFSVLLFFMSLLLFLNDKPLSRWWIIPFTLLTFLSLVAKPSFILAFVPSLGLLTAFLILRRITEVGDIIRKPMTLVHAFFYQNLDNADDLPIVLRPRYINWSVLIGGIVLPAFLILAYQAMTWTSSGGIGIAPFRVLFEWTLHYDDNADQMLAYKFLMSCAFPLIVYILHLRKTAKNLMFNLAWILYIVSAAYLYLLVDYTIIAAGDFGWSSQIAALILFIVATVFMVQHYSEWLIEQHLQSIQWSILLLCLGIFVLHVVAGVHWYRLHFNQPMSDLIYIWW